MSFVNNPHIFFAPSTERILMSYTLPLAFYHSESSEFSTKGLPFYFDEPDFEYDSTNAYLVKLNKKVNQLHNWIAHRQETDLKQMEQHNHMVADAMHNMYLAILRIMVANMKSCSTPAHAKARADELEEMIKGMSE